jgi:short subunit dehydrogenase-like uncharacterized protein
MIYGANGFTGELVAREAVGRGEKPVLAGRRRKKLEPLADELQCEVRSFDLDDVRLIVQSLEGISAVLHCAGPFSKTSAPMVEACLQAGAHYLDITGEIAVFEAIFAREEEAQRSGVALVPGVGFDVVPTDCLAAMLAGELPGADELLLAFTTRGGGVSPGTLKTIIENIGNGAAIRSDGRIIRVPPLYDVREISFPTGRRESMTIAWGDVSTAWRTTSIPNIRVYSGTGRKAIRRMRRLAPLLPLLGWSPVNRLLQLIASRKKGPDEALRKRSTMEVWGSVSRRDGAALSRAMITPEGYQFTAVSAVSALQRLLSMQPVPAGSFTPATLFGSGFVLEIPGVTLL